MKMFFRAGAWGGMAAMLAGWSAVYGQGQPAPEPEVKGPRIQFLETSHDFGTVQPTDKLTYDFMVTNLGNAVLEITDVTSSCGCTTIGAWDRTVPARGTGKIPVRLDPTALWGATTKSIAVSCNDPTHRGETLQIHVNVLRDVEVAPQTAHFIQVEGEMTNQTRTVRILNNLAEPLTLQPPESTNPNFVPELRTVKEGKEYQLIITCLGKVAERAQGTITIPTSSRKAGVLNVSAYVMRQPAIAVTPASVSLPANLNEASPDSFVLLRNYSVSPLQVSDATVNAAGVTVQTVVADPGKFFNFRIMFPPKFRVPAGESLELTFKTSHPRYPVVRVPIVEQAAAPPAALSK